MLVTGDWTVKISDFGLATIARSRRHYEEENGQWERDNQEKKNNNSGVDDSPNSNADSGTGT